MNTMATLAMRTALHLLETSLQATVVAAVVVLLGLLFRDRLSARWRCALWLVVVARLLLPIAPQSPVSLFNLLPGGLASRPAVSSETTPLGGMAVRTTGPRLADPVQLPPAPAAATGPVPAASPLDPPGNGSRRLTLESAGLWMAGGWLLGVLVLAARMVVRTIGLRRLLRGCVPVENAAVAGVFEATRAELGLRRRVALLASPLGVGPAIAGVFRPKLIVSESLLDRLSLDEWRLVFLHELSHVRRHDVGMQRLWMLAQTLHWFNPVVWFSARRWQADRELACDEAVLTRLDRATQVGYGHAILRVLESISSFRPVPGTVGVVMDRGFLARRIGVIAGYRSLSRRWTFLAAVMLLLLALAGLTNAVGPKAPPAGADTSGGVAKVEKTITITGTCTDEHRQPLDGVAVVVYEERRDGQPQRKVASGLTDQQGTFRFADLPAVIHDRQHREWLRYRVLTKKAGRASVGALLSGGSYFDERGEPADGVTVMGPNLELPPPKPASSPAENVDHPFTGRPTTTSISKPVELHFAIPSPSVLRGRVTNQEGKPVAGAAVVYGWYSQAAEGIRAAQTDEQGRFEISDAVAWEKENVSDFAIVRHPDYARGRIPVYGIPSMVEIALEPAATIRGRVIDTVTGRPAAGIPVGAQSTDKSGHDYGNCVLTDSEGAYCFSDVPSCSVNIFPEVQDRTAVAIDSLAIQAGQTRQVRDLELIEGGFLEGRVMDAQTGQAIFRTGQQRISVATYGPARPTSGAAVQSCEVDDQGRFRLRVPAGTYQPYICGELRSCPWQPAGFEVNSVELQDGQTRHVEFHVLPPGDDSQPPGSLHDYLLPPGSDRSQSTVRYLYRRQTSPPRAVPIAPAPAPPSDAQVTHNRDSLAVEGTVTTPDGKPSAAATVGLCEAVCRSTDFPRTTTDAHGHYRFTVKELYDYKVAAVNDGFVPTWKQISIGQDPQTVDLQLVEGKPIRVRVVDGEGKPLPDAKVRFGTTAEDLLHGNGALLFLDYQREPEYWLRSPDAEGRWSANWIPEDKILLSAEKEGYLRTQSILAPDDREVVFTLEPGICVSGRVVDRQTKAPIPRFRVTEGSRGGPNDRVTWDRSQSVENENGEYRVYFDTLADHRAIRIEADGYFPSEVQVLGREERQRTCNVELRKGEAVTGMVRSPEGKTLGRCRGRALSTEPCLFSDQRPGALPEFG